MKRFSDKYKEQIYAGVLGKIIGVYLGRPVEGWPYESIIERFGEVPYYIHDDLGLPLIVADDDISGTFAFFRSMEDNDFTPDLTAKQIGDTWLNYIIENRSILWWGGLGNSTEHTAFLHLKNGIDAPKSGSMELNGEVLSQQIGGQIFMDAYSMMCAGDPEKAVYFVKQCASVSHDGVGVDAACFLGALEAAAFDERSIDTLLDSCEKYIEYDLLRKGIHDVREACAKHNDWREVREFLDKHYGYGVFPGPCHMIPNHLMVIASIIMAGDDFAKSLKIATSAAWDTDCNAANVGCFNGIRLGLDAISNGPDFRGPVADRMLVITSDGGEGISDAVKESARIVKAAAVLSESEYEEPAHRYGFDFRGSVQGFMACPYFDLKKTSVAISNRNETTDMNGLALSFDALADGAPARVSVATFLDVKEEYRNYETYISPTLYSGQTVNAQIECMQEACPKVRPYVWYTDKDNELQIAYGTISELSQGTTDIVWKIPDFGGMPVLRFGFEFISEKRFDGTVVVRYVDWSNTPERILQEGVMMRDMWDLEPFWAKAFVSGAKAFTPNLNHTYVISHDEDNGLATIGTRDFRDYRVTSTLTPSLHNKIGLVARSQGHRRYYAAILSGGDTVSIVMQKDNQVETLGSASFSYQQFNQYCVCLTVEGSMISVAINGEKIVEACDENETYDVGSCGFIVGEGAMYIDGFEMIGIGS